MKKYSKVGGGGLKATHRANFRAFTLAEVLITLAVIGVVAALTLPTLLSNILEKQRAEKIRTVKYKFTQATEMMNANGLITKYDSTADFVNELQKYLKIIQVCDAGDLDKCWTYDKITLSDGTKIDVNDITDGTSFKRNKGDWSSPVVGIITGDGTPMILSYKKDCEPLDSGRRYPWILSDKKPETNETAACVSAIFDINGRSGKNKFKDDVVAFNANGIGNDCVKLAMDDKCFGNFFIPKALTISECNEIAEEYGIHCTTNNSDYWAGTVVECGGKQNMPNGTQAKALAKKIYDNTSNSNYMQWSNFNYNKAKAFGINGPMNFWTGSETHGSGGYGAILMQLSQNAPTMAGHYVLNYGQWRYASNAYGICLAD